MTQEEYEADVGSLDRRKTLPRNLPIWVGEDATAPEGFVQMSECHTLVDVRDMVLRCVTETPRCAVCPIAPP